MHSKIAGRAVVGAVATAISAASGPAMAAPIGPASKGNAWPDAASVDARLSALWQLRRDAAAAGRAASAACRDAEAKLPRVRPSPQSIAQDFHIRLRCGVDEKSAARLRDRDLARLEKRRRRQRAEERKLRLPTLERAAGAAWDRMSQIEGEIRGLPASPCVLAALALIEIAYECDAGENVQFPRDGTLEIAVRLLSALRPLLGVGAIADEVAELLDSPQKPIGDMALWPHSSVPAPAQSVRAA